MVRVRTKKAKDALIKSLARKGLPRKVSEKSLANLKPVQPGQVLNPSGIGGQQKIIFWPHVKRFLNMTEAQINAAKRTEALTMLQLGAIAFAIKFKDGSMAHQLEVVNREIGPPVSKPLASPEEQAALAREYLRQMMSSVPNEKGVQK